MSLTFNICCSEKISITILTVTFQNAANVVRELTALTIAQCFTASIVTVKYSVLFGLFKFGLGLDLKCLASFNISAHTYCIFHFTPFSAT